jgi:hypothetical protein
VIVTGVNVRSAMGMDATLVFIKIAVIVRALDGKIFPGGCKADSR